MHPSSSPPFCRTLCVPNSYNIFSMSTKFNQSLLMFTLKILLLNSFSRSSYVAADNTFPGQVAFAPPLQPYECPYPCLPPPIPTTSSSPPPPSLPVSQAPPPPPPSSSVYYPPPPSGWFYPPPAGYFPFYPPPYYVNNYLAPPPPDPILPYFPYYYKNPPPPFEFSSAASLNPLRACCIFFIAQVLNVLYHVIVK